MTMYIVTRAGLSTTLKKPTAPKHVLDRLEELGVVLCKQSYHDYIDNEEVIKLLMQSSICPSDNDDADCAFCYAVKDNKIDAVRLMLTDERTDVGCIEDFPLNLAVLNNNVEMVHLLLDTVERCHRPPRRNAQR
jgi:hypothetical protein